MNYDATYIISMRFESVHAIQCVVIEDADLHIVRTGDDPILAWHKLGGSNRQIAHLKSLDELLILMIPDVYVAVVEGT